MRKSKLAAELAPLRFAAAQVGTLEAKPDWANRPMHHLVATLILISILLPIAVVDQRRQIIPDFLNLLLLLTGLIYSASYGFRHLLWAFVSVVATGLFFATLRWTYEKLRRRQGLGLGDVKFLAASGAWISLIEMPWLVLAASMSALLYFILIGLIGNSGLSFADRIAFGPHLAIGLIAVWLLKFYIL